MDPSTRSPATTHPATVQRWQAAHAARSADPVLLARLLTQTRQRTLDLLDRYAVALGPPLQVPQNDQLNPPLWEMGHIAWFQEVWIARNKHRQRGIACDIDAARNDSILRNADSVYDSSRVIHASRWSLPMPDLQSTLDYAGAVLDQTLSLLQHSASDDVALYFFRLALFHEDMHAEAATYTAQALGIDMGGKQAVADFAAHATERIAPNAQLKFPAQEWTLGWATPGFAFDNELASQSIALDAFEIDCAPVSWQKFLAFVDDGGYQNQRWWSPQGWQWLTTSASQGQPEKLPRYLRRGAGGSDWQAQRFGAWQALDLQTAAVHLSYFEAQAWCQWAGRRLPTEAQWECAAMADCDFQWGEVWEWTASPFAPFAGFSPHPYRDYSAPWMDNRPVLKGASNATAIHMVHPRYRNFFTAERNDIYSGFRSCSQMKKLASSPRGY